MKVHRSLLGDTSPIRDCGQMSPGCGVGAGAGAGGGGGGVGGIGGRWNSHSSGYGSGGSCQIGISNGRGTTIGSTTDPGTGCAVATGANASAIPATTGARTTMVDKRFTGPLFERFRKCRKGTLKHFSIPHRRASTSSEEHELRGPAHLCPTAML